MKNFTHYLAVYKQLLRTCVSSTPSAIITGSVIIALSIIAYGFITKTPVVTTENPLPKILKQIGISKSEFIQCVNSGEKAQAVADEINDGVTAGVTGTPTTFILREENGALYTVATISGAQDKNLFMQAIDQALALKDVTKWPKLAGKPITSSDLEEKTAPTKVYVIEYSDTECPFCARLHPDLKDVRTAYAGKISFVYRNFPLTSIHQHAQKEAEMIACVGQLGGAKAYFPFIDAVFDWKIKNNIGYLPWSN